MQTAIKYAIGFAAWFALFIVGAGLMLALERRGFRPHVTIARVLSPDSSVSLEES